MTPLDLRAWWEANKPPEPALAPQRASVPAVRGANRLDKYAAGALEAECRAVESAPPGNRNNALNRAAVAMGELVGSGQLAVATVEQSLTESARLIGLADHEISKTIASGLGYGMSQPRNLMELATTGHAAPPAKPPHAGGQLAQAEDGDGPNCVPGTEDNPHRLARVFLREKYAHPDGLMLRFWNDEFWAWTHGAYRPFQKKEAQALVNKALKEEFNRIYDAELIKFGMAKDGEQTKQPKPIPVTTTRVADVVQALSGETMLSTAEYPDQPRWIDGDEGWPIHEIMPMRHNIVHLPSYVDGKPCTRKATPRLFCSHSLNYDFDRDAPEPKRWLEFLGARPIEDGSPIKNQVWPDDPESIATLQEWMGLNLVPDIRYQKIMAMIGPKRAGKGTIAEVMRSLVGTQNCCGPTATALEETFGMQDWVGKLSAIFDDFRVGSRANHAAVAEKLLTISGGGMLTVRRMHRPGWTGHLPCRITLLSNSLPKFNDESGALADRFVILRFTRSFYGEEDIMLDNILNTELPGILRWAIEGWGRLRARGRLLQPASGLDDTASLKDLASPISAFIDDCCDVGEGKSCLCSEVFRAWKAWCEEQGKEKPGDLPMLSRNLRSVLPNLKTKQSREDGRHRRFHGIDLKPPTSLLGGKPATEADYDFTGTGIVPF